jgi:hypothetical protein
VERELAAYFTELIAAKRAEPGEDLVSALVVARDNDGAVGRADRQRAPFRGLPAGHGGLRHHRQPDRLRHPGAADPPRADGPAAAGPSLLPAAMEELLRFTSPVNHANDRFTTEDVPVGGVVIPPGEWVSPRSVPPTGTRPGSPARTASTSAATPAATSPSATAFTTAWALPWPAWRPRSPSAPCSPASRESRSRWPRPNSAGVRQPDERPGIPPRPPRLTGQQNLSQAADPGRAEPAPTRFSRPRGELRLEATCPCSRLPAIWHTRWMPTRCVPSQLRPDTAQGDDGHHGDTGVVYLPPGRGRDRRREQGNIVLWLGFRGKRASATHKVLAT